MKDSDKILLQSMASGNVKAFDAIYNKYWYGLESIQMNDPGMKCSVTGTYTRMTLEEIMETIKYATGIAYEIEGKKLKVRKGNC
ncbi:MAG: DUF4974 domain-containing protein [Cyclobacteriaceae bacterium]